MPRSSSPGGAAVAKKSFNTTTFWGEGSETRSNYRALYHNFRVRAGLVRHYFTAAPLLLLLKRSPIWSGSEGSREYGPYSEVHGARESIGTHRGSALREHEAPQTRSARAIEGIGHTIAGYTCCLKEHGAHSGGEPTDRKETRNYDYIVPEMKK